MTRAIRFVIVVAGFVYVSSAWLAAQNYQSGPQGPQQGSQIGPQQGPAPQRASVYGPAVGSQPPNSAQNQPQQVGPTGQYPSQRQSYPAAQVAQQQPVQGQPSGVQPAAGQQPIRQPGAVAGPGGANPNGVNPNGAGAGQGGLGVMNGIPKVQVVPPGMPGPQQPEWFPLDPKVQEWVDQVLIFWEKRSDQVKTLECTFQKWEYDPGSIPNVVQQLQVQGKLHEMPFTKYATGKVKYAAPDKGLFRVDQLQTIDAKQAGQPGAKTKYDVQPKENGEHWVCDGKRIFAFDANPHNKQVIERQLPPEMQGKALMDGPLPFMFGARAETIKARYWIRPLQAEGPGEYCLEAVPKSRQDAANFKSVQIVLDEKEYLPIKMQIFEADFSPKNPHRTAFKFDQRKVNASDVGPIPAVFNPLQLPLNKMNPWAREFYEVKIPAGWKHVLVDAEGKIVPPAGTAATPPPPTGPAPALQR